MSDASWMSTQCSTRGNRFFPADEDEVRLRRKLGTTLKRLDELKFVRRFQEKPEAWEVCRLLKARLPLSELENLRQQLLAEVPA